jgi:hypothetical protein
VQAVRLGAEGSPGTLHTLSEPGQDARFPQPAVDAQGRATVVWHRFDGANTRVQAVRLGAEGSPGTLHTLSDAGQDASPPQLAVDAQGRATVVWSRSDGMKRRVQATRATIVAPETRIDSGPREGAAIASASARFAFSGTPAAETARFECRLDAGDFAACTSPARVGRLANGRHTFEVRAVDATGDADPTPAKRTFRVAVKASIAGLRVAPSAFRAPKGAIVSFRASRPAAVRYRVARVLPGRLVPVRGSFSRRAAAGPNRFRFTGRIGGRTLPPGSYRLRATPRNTAGAGPTRTVGFRIVR